MGFFRFLPVSSGFFRFLPVSSGFFRFLPVSSMRPMLLDDSALVQLKVSACSLSNERRSNPATPHRASVPRIAEPNERRSRR
jgi:hypothetical protein